VSALEVQQLSTGYGAIRALEEVSLEVREGEVVALVGPNGAGKSTLLRTISGLLKPWAGRVVFDGLSLTGRTPAWIVRRGIIHVPEGRAILKRMSVTENLEMGAYARADRKSIAGEIERIFERFPPLADRRNQAGGTLSGGEQQMLAVGRALLARPRVLMMDEPSLGLAPVIVTELFKLIAQLKSDGMTILLVEQNARQALRVADRGYVIETGHIQLEGAAETLLASRRLQETYLGVAPASAEPRRLW
jgi:branched-chain amino acid transport system ATP-binding protein